MVDQHSALRVKLADILEGMDFQSDERSSFLNLTTGEVVSITDEELRAAEHDVPLEDFPEWQHDAIRIAGEIIETDHYLPLPDRFEIHEYSIMERFCLSVDDEDMRDDLCDAIRSRSIQAFQRQDAVVWDGGRVVSVPRCSPARDSGCVV